MIWAATLSLAFCSAVTAFDLDVLPKPASWTLRAPAQSFDLTGSFGITVDRAFAQTTATSGLSLIPPTLKSFVQTFARDLQEAHGARTVVRVASEKPASGVWLTVTPNLTTLADGTVSEEGYSIQSDGALISVTGSSALGVWWATRTILQAAALNGGIFPAGELHDGPDYGIRGHMLDVGRHWYSAEVRIPIISQTGNLRGL